MELASIASGSSGNCIYIGNEETHFLVDTGISRKRVVDGLKEMDITPDKIDGIFVTHEHIDHISGLGVFLRKYPVPVYATGKTIDRIFATRSLGNMNPDLFVSISPDHPMNVDGIQVEASHIYHDAADPVCYTFSDQESKVGIATDFGTYDDYLVDKMQGCESLLVEANHDLNMLMVGPYPYPLKRRIMGNTGHLSNERAGQFLSKVIGQECRHIFLGHLSKENNYRELAYETVQVELLAHNINIEEKNMTMQVADRYQPTICMQ
ncbi:MAG: MBL fold metallo-hydrolase [Clostridiales bacterium]|nr:MBL fold metallo-hydrolase [Clostridiales bacterium]